MKNTVAKLKLIILFGCIAAVNSASAQLETLWTIGERGDTSVKFALSSNYNYQNFVARFGGEHTNFYVGYSTPEKDWPYILPGPIDGWAGGGYWSGSYPRHLPRIFFNIKNPQRSGIYKLHLNFADVQNENPPLVRVTINGHVAQLQLKPGRGKGIDGPTAPSEEQDYSIDIPFAWIRSNLNTIQLVSMKGSWAVFKNIYLEGLGSVRLAEASSSLILSAKAADFEVLRQGKRYQPLLVDIEQLDKNMELKFNIEGLQPIVKTIEKGHSILEIPVPALKKNAEDIAFTISNRNMIIYRGQFKRSRQPLQHLYNYVDLLMGTGNSRWMFKPGPSLPLSMVQIAPDNQDETWKAGYEYTVDNIMGFSHFSDWTMCGLLTMPTGGKLQVNPGTEDDPDAGYRSRIDKKTESAKIGRYSVFLSDTKIKAEITATRRAALQRYTFPKMDSARIMVDLFTPNEYPHNLVAAKVIKMSNNEITGEATYYNAFTGYSLQQYYTVYFVLQFNKPFSSMGAWVNDSIKPVTAYIPNWDRKHVFNTPSNIFQNIDSISGKGDLGVFLNYKTTENEQIIVRSGVSLVDLEGARNNLQTELTTPFNWDFEKVVKNAQNIWDQYLGRVEIHTDDYLQKKKFYTNLYRALAAKAVWNDADGRFRDEKERIVQLKNKNTDIVSGEYWNTFWNNQQLFNLVAPEISSKWARSAIALYNNSGWFNTDPAGVENTGVMVAMHVISQIQGAWQSGIKDFDLQLAYTGLRKMMTTPPEKYPGGGTVGVENIVPYTKYGYIPNGMGEVSNTMEYTYDDWCLAQMALTLNKTDDYHYFLKRSENWKHIFDEKIGYVRPKDQNGNWISPFDPYHTPGFVEGNAFNYTWFVPQNPNGLINKMGKKRFVSTLNDAMEKSANANFNASGDNFAAFPINHGNEPSMQVAYLFNWAGKPALTQKWVRAIQEQYYGTTPYDAYPGDEDLGQMSSWFVMSAIGLFQMDGGCAQHPVYELGSPRYPKIVIHLDQKYKRGSEFIIEAKNASKQNKYIQCAFLNGKPLIGFKVLQAEVLKGGKLQLIMGSKPKGDQ